APRSASLPPGLTVQGGYHPPDAGWLRANRGSSGQEPGERHARRPAPGGQRTGRAQQLGEPLQAVGDAGLVGLWPLELAFEVLDDAARLVADLRAHGRLVERLAQLADQQDACLQGALDVAGVVVATDVVDHPALLGADVEHRAAHRPCSFALTFRRISSPVTISTTPANSRTSPMGAYLMTGSKTPPMSGGSCASNDSPTLPNTLSTPLNTANPYTPIPARNRAIPRRSTIRARRRMGAILRA